MRGRPWDRDELERLYAMHHAGKKQVDIAKALGRQVESVRSRLYKAGLIELEGASLRDGEPALRRAAEELGQRIEAMLARQARR